jgi:type I restriction enzyme S subunit
MKSDQAWQVARVGDILKIRNGYAVKSSDYSREGIPLIRQSDINGDTIDISTAKRVPTRVMEECGQYLVRKGDLLIGMSGSLGKMGRYVGEEVAIQNQRTGLLQVKSGFTAGFAKLVLKLVEQQIIAEGKGVAVQNVSAKEIEDCTFPLPPQGERERIVAEIEKQFTRLDAGVSSLKHVRTALKRYRASVLKAACEGRLVPTEAELARKENRSYETAEQLFQRILKERRETCSGKGTYKEPLPANIVDLPQLPEGWTWATMQQLGELSRGKSKHRPRDDAKLYGGPYPFVQTGDIRKSGGTIREHHQNYSEAGLQQSRLWPAKTLCITIAANIAETGLLTYPACFPDSVVGFLQENSPIITRYVEFFLRTAKERIESLAPATAQKNINLDVLQKVAIPLPPLAEQTRIVEGLEKRLSVVDKIEAILNVNLHRGNRLKQSVLASAFQASRHLI